MGLSIPPCVADLWKQAIQRTSSGTPDKGRVFGQARRPRSLSSRCLGRAASDVDVAQSPDRSPAALTQRLPRAVSAEPPHRGSASWTCRSATPAGPAGRALFGGGGRGPGQAPSARAVAAWGRLHIPPTLCEQRQPCRRLSAIDQTTDPMVGSPLITPAEIAPSIAGSGPKAQACAFDLRCKV